MKKIKVSIPNGIVVELDVTAYVKWENRAAAAKKSVSEMLANFLAKEGTTNL